MELNFYNHKPCGDVWIEISDQEKCQDGDFIVYNISVSQLKKDKSYPGWTVERRYRDFDLLNVYLELKHPSLLLPPLPSKMTSALKPWRYLQQNTDQDFLEERRQRLEIYLQRLLAKSETAQNSVLLNGFLASSPDLRKSSSDWINAATSALSSSASADNSQSFQEKEEQERSLIETAVNFTKKEKVTKLLKRTISTTALKNINETDRKLAERVLHSASAMQKHIRDMLSAQQEVYASQIRYWQMHRGLGEALCEWCALERDRPDWAEVLQKCGHLVDSFAALAEEDQNGGATGTALSVAGSTKWTMDVGASGGVAAMLELRLGEYDQYANSLTSLIERFEDSNIALHTQRQNVELMRKNLAKFRMATSSLGSNLDNGNALNRSLASLRQTFTRNPVEKMSDEEKMQHEALLKSNIEEGEKKLDELQRQTQNFMNTVHSELEAFERQKLTEFDVIFSRFIENERRTNDKSVKIWQKIVNELETL